MSATGHDAELIQASIDAMDACDKASAEIGALCKALIRLLWRSVADEATCTCDVSDTCPECEAMTALGLGRWRSAEVAWPKLRDLELKLEETK